MFDPQNLYSRDGLKWLRERVMIYSKPWVTDRKGDTGISAWALQSGIPVSRVSEFMNGKRAPTDKMLNAMNLEWRIMPQREFMADWVAQTIWNSQYAQQLQINWEEAKNTEAPSTIHAAAKSCAELAWSIIVTPF